MRQVNCLVVCEGSSDFAILEKAVEAIAERNKIKIRLILQEPQLDATSNKYEKFGYEGVRSWCLHKQSKKRLGQDLIKVMMAFAQADMLIIHLDGDIAERIQIDGTNFNQIVNERRAWCEQGLNYWLGVARDKTSCHYVIPCYQIETWLLATYDSFSAPSVFSNLSIDYEKIEDVESSLLSLGYVEDHERAGRLYKEYNLYKKDERYSRRILLHFNTLLERCGELNAFNQLFISFS